MRCEVIKEIDAANKIIKVSMQRKFSVDFEEYCKRHSGVSIKNILPDEDEGSQKEYTLLVSYQMMGQRKNRACISLFEVDVDSCAINPATFLILSQRVDKDM
mmetsp:Transcript_16326/g.27605  ORF Transcript_16326/g.27605 Transcript_16326/m.27605 type:complete len:102 (+) Transcript_16326:2399-2704(+)